MLGKEQGFIKRSTPYIVNHVLIGGERGFAERGEKNLLLDLKELTWFCAFKPAVSRVWLGRAEFISACPPIYSNK